MEPWGVSEEFFDKYAWNFLKYVQWFSIYIHTFACFTAKQAARDREPGKVEKEVLAIPSRAAGYEYGHTDNSFRVPGSSTRQQDVRPEVHPGLTEFCTELTRITAEKGGIRVSGTGALVE